MQSKESFSFVQTGTSQLHRALCNDISKLCFSIPAKLWSLRLHFWRLLVKLWQQSTNHEKSDKQNGPKSTNYNPHTVCNVFNSLVNFCFLRVLLRWSDRSKTGSHWLSGLCFLYLAIIFITWPEQLEVIRACMYSVSHLCNNTMH